MSVKQHLLDPWRLLSKQARQAAEHSKLSLLLSALQPHDSVVQVQQGGWLHVDCGSSPGGPHFHTPLRQLPLPPCFYGDTQPPPFLGHLLTETLLKSTGDAGLG